MASIRFAFVKVKVISFLLIVAAMLLVMATSIGCGSIRRSASTSIDEQAKTRAVTVQQAEQVVEPSPIQVETVLPDGQKTTITTPPKSTTSYNLSDNTTASSQIDQFFESTFSGGVSWMIAAAVFLIALTIFFKMTIAGRATQQTVRLGLDAVNSKLAATNSSEEREVLYEIKNILDQRR